MSASSVIMFVSSTETLTDPEDDSDDNNDDTDSGDKEKKPLETS
jgi:hypothetical protein